jgi:hypothetical protein
MSSLTNYWFVLLYSRVHEPMWMTHMNTQVQWGDQKCHLRVRGVVFRRHEALDDVIWTSCGSHSSHTFGGLPFSEGLPLGIDKLCVLLVFIVAFSHIQLNHDLFKR